MPKGTASDKSILKIEPRYKAIIFLMRKSCCGCWLQIQNTSHIWAITSPILMHIFAVWLQQSLKPVANKRCNIDVLKHLNRVTKVIWRYWEGVGTFFNPFAISLIYFLLMLMFCSTIAVPCIYHWFQGLFLSYGI